MSIKISLNELELRDVVIEHVKASYGFPLDGKNVDIKFTAGRKGAGTSVEIEISNANDALGNMSVVDAANARKAAINATGVDALGHASSAEGHATPVNASTGELAADSVQESTDDDNVDLPPVTPETPVSPSIFD